VRFFPKTMWPEGIWFTKHSASDTVKIWRTQFTK